ncbi:MAG: hypothetical protein NZ889_00760 [Candidatus Pacearchaeota archaeon]|nr:hypothetical protein [Candidatus Pacearchaeota archaeon]
MKKKKSKKKKKKNKKKVEIKLKEGEEDEARWKELFEEAEQEPQHPQISFFGSVEEIVKKEAAMDPTLKIEEKINEKKEKIFPYEFGSYDSQSFYEKERKKEEAKQPQLEIVLKVQKEEIPPAFVEKPPEKFLVLEFEKQQKYEKYEKQKTKEQEETEKFLKREGKRIKIYEEIYK